MKIRSTILVFLLFSSFIYAQNNTVETIDWQNPNQLNFDHFKGKPIKSKGVKGEFSTKISWVIKQYPGEVPNYTVYNRMIPSTSWLSMKHKELLQEYQFLFNISELYTRKIRKEILELNKKNIIDKEIYKASILKLISIQSKEKKKFEGVLFNQPDLYKHLNEKYQDSLKIYQKYTL